VSSLTVRLALLALAGLLCGACERIADVEDLHPADGQAEDQDPADGGAADAPIGCAPAGDGGSSPCPAEMVLAAPPGVCVDRYEAAYESGDLAIAGHGLVPWTEVTFDEAAAACARAGKRLCLEAEWRAACQGPCGRAYPYGDTHLPAACNDREGSSGRGLQPTGAYAACEGGLAGIYDLAGNAREWVVPDGQPAAAAGGSYDDLAAEAACASAAVLPAATRDVRVGFRCCLTP
jgi:hypothetical protein